jgi:hypothetical protein
MNSWLSTRSRTFAAFMVVASGSLAQPGWAGEQIVTLTDGSRIKGEVTALQAGQYTIETESLSVVEVIASREVSIIAADAAPFPPI